MTFTELEAQNETGLLAIMSNESANHDMRAYAAVLLYKRGSRFLAFEEFRRFRPDVLDYILNEHADAPLKPFAPNVVTDMAGRLHDRMVEANTRLDQHTDTVQTVQSHLTNIQHQHAKHYDEHKENVAKVEEEVHARLDEHETVLNEHEAATSAVAETTANAFEAVRAVTAELGVQIDRSNKRFATIADRHQQQHDEHAEFAIRRLAEHDVKIHKAEKVSAEMDDQIVRNLDDHRKHANERSNQLAIKLAHTDRVAQENKELAYKQVVNALKCSIDADATLRAELAYLKKILWYVAPSLFVLSQIGSYLIKHFAR